MHKINKATVTKVAFLLKEPKVSVNTNPEPGMGKGKVRGAGKAEFGTKFSGVY